jgi:acyl transferase domain-containing protein
MTSLHFLSPDSKSHAFDADANGYSRGEGASFVVLKPLDLALKDHDVIRGIIRNTAVNQDGNIPGIIVLSAEAQETVVRNCYQAAGLSLADIQYVEAHGTGTSAGDPLEVSALSKPLEWPASW